VIGAKEWSAEVFGAPDQWLQQDSVAADICLKRWKDSVGKRWKSV